MNIILIISALITVAVAEVPALSCLYSVSIWTNRYECYFTINNPDGLNNFTEIGGIHLEGFTNADVEEFWIVRHIGCVSTNVPRIICDTFQNIIWFDFIDLGITEIGDSDFAGCSRITELVLRYNRITTISTNAFGTLSTLWGIGLEFNNLKTLPENVFANQRDMRYLELDMNPIDSIPDLRPLENLQYLYLRSTNINEINSQWFSHMRLEVLDMSNSSITALPDSFVGLEELGQLHLNSNAIREIPSGVFTALSNLERLSLDNNNLNELQPDSFSSLGTLKVLSLGRNPIEVIHEEAFRGLVNLIELNLQACSLSQIYKNSFEALERLNILRLSINNISVLQPDSFSGMRQLLRLFIGNNPIEAIYEGAFRGLVNLIELNLQFCRIRQIYKNSFENLERLNILQLSHNNISELQPDSFSGMRQLLRLFINNNPIEAIYEGAFRGLVNLIELNLQFCRVRQIYKNSFENLERLNILQLSDNNISELQPDSFSELRQLLRLFIENNPIETIYEGAFRGLDNLIELSLRNCRLRQIHSYYFENLKSLNILQLDANEIEEIAEDAFVELNLQQLRLWRSRLITLHRKTFGSLTNLRWLAVHVNIVNVLDRAIIDDAVNLDRFDFSGNLCANRIFTDFSVNLAENLQILQACFDNYGRVVDTTTEGDAEFSFFEAPQHGIILRAYAANEIQIALTQFDFISSLMIEIFIGTTNNTASVIRMNQEIVVTVPTPNIIAPDESNDFRITWSNGRIEVFRGRSRIIPFLDFTMPDFFPINFYGLRAIETKAVWSVQQVQPLQNVASKMDVLG